MRHIVKSASVLLLAGYTGVAGASDCSSLASLRWLQGEWLAEGADTTWRETWTEAGPKTWEGRGVETSRADPARQSAEELRLVEMGGGVFYVAKVTHNELPIAFRMVECGEGRAVFVNPTHDFPRRLDYEREADDRLRVRASDGAGKGFTLGFVRQPAAAADAAAVLSAEDARFAAMVAADPDAMRRWMADDLEYVHSTGVVESRPQLIDTIQEARLRYREVMPSDRSVAFLGSDAAIVQGQARFGIEAGPKRLDFVGRYLAVYRREGGDWRLRAWQSLRLP